MSRPFTWHTARQRLAYGKAPEGDKGADVHPDTDLDYCYRTMVAPGLTRREVLSLFANAAVLPALDTSGRLTATQVK